MYTLQVKSLQKKVNQRTIVTQTDFGARGQISNALAIVRRYGRRDVVCWFTGSSVRSSWHLTATASESHVTSNQAGQQRMDGQWSSEWVEQGLALKPWPMSAFTRLSYFSVAGRNRHSQGHLGKGGFIGDSPLEREPTTITAGSVPARARRSSRNS